ncbi:hypothetical protein NBM05_10285 [Rothia sp. AR01]|uniref:Uncharacterized protein n=1 Tax=Rothia santali TaxID=2949643 RepID=A0A9X2HK50_9MICC|nr:hypothetical protein [Rothia santali]MCP3426378.1 hypothetical protein [Rothia santali]
MSTQTTRSRRLARGWSVASVAIFGGASAHVVAGGQLPSTATLAACWALAGLLCTVLAGQRHRATSTAASVIGSQAVLHWLFERAPSPAGAPLSGEGPHAGHLQHLASSPAVPMQHDALDPVMAALHLGVALATLMFIRRGDAVLRTVEEAVRIGLGRLWRVPVLRSPLPRVRSGLIASAPRLLSSLARPGPVSVRGPPTPSLP